MSPPARRHPTAEGRSGSRIDFQGGGCYLGIPDSGLSERSRVSREPGAVQDDPARQANGAGP